MRRCQHEDPGKASPVYTWAAAASIHTQWSPEHKSWVFGRHAWDGASVIRLCSGGSPSCPTPSSLSASNQLVEISGEKRKGNNALNKEIPEALYLTVLSLHSPTPNVYFLCPLYSPFTLDQQAGYFYRTCWSFFKNIGWRPLSRVVTTLNQWPLRTWTSFSPKIFEIWNGFRTQTVSWR